MLLTISAEYAGKKRGESKANKTRSCVSWRFGFVNHQEQIILRAIEKKKKIKKSTRHLLVVICYLVPIVYQET